MKKKTKPNAEAEVRELLTRATGESRPLDLTEELNTILRQTLESDSARRTYMRLALEGLVKAAVKGNVEAVKMLIRQVNMAELAAQAKKQNKAKG